jgi:NADPH:quinone reductase-like Zn-dependent oxidoreductase
MKAIVYRNYGSPEVLRYEDAAKPVPKANEVLIRVRAASVNPLDWHLMRGTPGFVRLFTGLRRPKNTRLGVDVAGVVESLGPNVTQFQVGDAVFGACNAAFAVYACAPESAVVKKPGNVSFEEAASVAIAGFTALQALRNKAHLQPGQALLINGAAGGVGTFAVQIAHWMGAVVTGVCSEASAEMVRRLGADHLVDYAREDFAAGLQRYDVVFDLVGNRSISDFLRVLQPAGTYIGCGGGGPDKPALDLVGRMVGTTIRSWFVRQKLLGILAQRNKDDLRLLAELIESGKITPEIDRCYRLEEVPEAIRYLEKGHARGKVVITIQ